MFNKLILRFLKDLKPFQIGIWLAFIGSLLSAALEPVMPWILQPILDSSVQQPKTPSAWRIEAWMIPVIITGLFILRGIINYFTNYVMTWSSQRLIEVKRNYIFDLVLNAKPSLFEQQPASHLINTITMVVTNAISAFVNSIQQIIRDGLTLLALVAFLLYLNWQLTLIAFATIPLMVYFVKMTKTRINKTMRSFQQGMDGLSYMVEENVLAFKVVRLFGLQKIQYAKFVKINQNLRSVMLRMTAATSLLTPLTQVVAALAASVIIYIAIIQTGSNGLSVGKFMSYIVTMLMIIPKAKSLSDLYANVQVAYVALERLYELEDETRESEEIELGKSFAVAKGELTFENLSVIYPNSDVPALDNISLHINGGEMVAFVGSSGSGKTTLVNLIPRFLEPTGGRILLDNVALTEWNLNSLRSKMAMVSQDIVLFNTSVAENVAMRQSFAEIIDEEKVRFALKSAFLLDFVESLPHGIHNCVGHNGNNLSGGQKQRLAIARAIYQNTPILILDEATSALDAKSEDYVKKAIDNVAKNRTTIIVAHRLSTIKDVDRIIVFSEGKILEMGAYEELIGKKGAFYSLVQTQLSS